MAKAKKAVRKKKPRSTAELPLGDGPGVSRTRIPSVEAAASKYIIAKERRMTETPKEVSAKKELISLLHRHEDKIGRDGEGVLRYTTDDQKTFVLQRGEEKLSVVKAPPEDEEL